MTNSSPQPPEPSEQRQRRRTNLTFDEVMAILVAFGTIGTILFWSLGTKRGDLNISGLQDNLLLSRDTDKIDVSNQNDRDSAIGIDLFSRTDQSEINDTATENITGSAVSGDTSTRESDSTIAVTSPRTTTSDSQSRSNFLPFAAPVSTVPSLITGRDADSVKPGSSEANQADGDTSTTPDPLETDSGDTPEATDTPDSATSDSGDTSDQIATDTPEATDTPDQIATDTDESDPTDSAAADDVSTSSFSDVPNDYWAYPFVQKLSEEKLISGMEDGTFEPDKAINRAEMASLISQAFDQPTSQASKQFKDVAVDDALSSNINKAVETGFMKGYSDDEFRPQDLIPRYQVLVTLVTGLGLKPSGDVDRILQNFADSNTLPVWAKEQVAAATESGLAVNRPGFSNKTLKPDAPATRAEVAAMIYQALAKSGKLEPIESQYIVNP